MRLDRAASAEILTLASLDSALLTTLIAAERTLSALTRLLVSTDRALLTALTALARTLISFDSAVLRTEMACESGDRSGIFLSITRRSSESSGAARRFQGMSFAIGL